MKTLKDIGERGAIERICSRLPSHEGLLVGPGDDCSVVRDLSGSGEDWLFTSDPVIQAVHFDDAAAPHDVGHKAVGRVLSDIAAMGGVPAWGLIDMVAGADTPVSILDELYDGACEIADRYGFVITGGDVSCGHCIEMHVFGAGRVPAGRAVLRSGARPGDLLFVTGSLGGSLRSKHLHFDPRVEEGIWLRDWASAMIDLSDGLASDLRRLTTAGGVGCELQCDAVPVATAARSMDDGVAPLQHAMCDGEDFELLFTVRKSRSKAFLNAWRDRFNLDCTQIGEVNGNSGSVICLFPDGRRGELDANGYSHFSRNGGQVPVSRKAAR